MLSHKVNEDFTARSKLKDIGRWHITQFVKKVSDNMPSGSSILDVGAGECVYKKYFSHCKYVAVDLAVGNSSWNYRNLDCIARLHALPVSDRSFDAILCTQVLEHLEWPRESMKEFYRALKPEGKLFITAPMSHSEHQIPHDFFRYTSYGLRSILLHAGFHEGRITIKPFGGICTKLAYELPRLMGLFPTGQSKLSIQYLLLLPARLLFLAVIRMMQLLLIFIDRFDLRKNDTFGWSAEAQK